MTHLSFPFSSKVSLIILVEKDKDSDGIVADFEFISSNCCWNGSNDNYVAVVVLLDLPLVSDVVALVIDLDVGRINVDFDWFSSSDDKRVSFIVAKLELRCSMLLHVPEKWLIWLIPSYITHHFRLKLPIPFPLIRTTRRKKTRHESHEIALYFIPFAGRWHIRH